MSSPAPGSSPWIVTGASRGLGRELVLALAARGHTVLAIARESDDLRQLAVPASHGRIVPVPLDLGHADAVTPAFECLVLTYGAPAGLINNAGIGSYKPFVEHGEAELLAILQVNLGAVMQACRVVLPAMLARAQGQIINIGSDLGRRPLAFMAAYVASKHGLAGLSHSLLREVKDSGVRVSLVNPGMIDTGFGGNAVQGRDDDRTLSPARLAAVVMQLIELSPQLVVDELTVHPMGQADF